jgi:hypothetical protein
LALILADELASLQETAALARSNARNSALAYPEK